ncbi:MAG TPA: alcohol dehydrogenase [Paraburkholderia sp.]|jgi:propanol-preferring alcohol dehydrogenase|nr:alcohol dehydrogenase [Paraburkholderia sp.]
MNHTYKAIQAIAPGQLAMVDLPLLEPPPGHVRIRVEACGVCHSDSWTVDGTFLPGIAYPRVPGHEVVGRIDALGEATQPWQIGQRVGVGFLGGHCGICRHCRRGDTISCEAREITGISVDGGYAEVMIAKSNALASIPHELQSVDAAPLLCAGLTTFNALRNAKARSGELVAIQGVGGLGHLAIQYAAHMGFRVAAISRGMDKQALALQLGAHYYVDSAAQDVAAELQRLGGAKAILATAAVNQSMAALTGGLAPRGELLIAGLGGSEAMAVDALPLVRGSRSIVGSLTGDPIDSEDTLDFSVLQGIHAMSETYPLERAGDAYRRMKRNEARFRVVLVTGQ